MKRQFVPIALIVALLPMACGDHSTPTSPPDRPSEVIFDGAHSDEADDAFFLPPVAPDPSGHENFDAGAFNPSLRPAVRICELTGDPDLDPMTDCALDQASQPILVASFSGDDINMSLSDEHYHVNWHTNESTLFLDRFYRIQIFLGSRRVAFADVDPVEHDPSTNARRMRNVRTDEEVNLVDGSTLPIRVRLEHGVLCDNESDCGEFAVTNEGGTFLTNTNFAGIRFEPNFLPDGIDEITLTIERVPVEADNACHGVSSSRLWREFEGCYSFTVDPDFSCQPGETTNCGLQAPALVAKCTELDPNDPLYDLQLGYKSRNGLDLRALPNVTLPLDFGLNCEGFQGTVAALEQSVNPLMWLATAGLHRLGSGFGRILGIRPLYAIDLGLGDRLVEGESLSNINWGIGLESAATTDLTPEVGFGLSTDLEVLVSHVHFHEEPAGDDVDGSTTVTEHPHAIGGVTVVYEVVEGAGSFLGPDGVTPVQRVEVVTSFGGESEDDAPGLAGLSFTADPNAVANVVTATAPTILEQPVTFTITGLSSDLQVAELTGTPVSPTESDALNWSFVVLNTGSGVAVPSTARLTIALVESEGQPLAIRDFAINALPPGGSVMLTTELEIGPLVPGSYVATATADHLGEVLEVEPGESNNSEQVQFTVAEDAIEFVAVATGGAFSCGLNDTGKAYCWGVNGTTGAPEFALGVETTSETCFSFDCETRPVAVSDPLTGPVAFTAITAGYRHACALTQEGEAYCWGLNNGGQLGDGSTTNSFRPVKVQSTASFVQIAAGGLFTGHTCAVTSAGELYCWGANGSGQLGDNSTTTQTTPVLVDAPEGATWTHVSTGSFHTCAIASTDRVYCWGANGSGQLGIGSSDPQSAPVEISSPGESDPVAYGHVSAADAHSCGVSVSGDVFCWGRNDLGQLGTGDQINSDTPRAVARETSDFAEVQAMGFATCALSTVGAAWCWGRDGLGELGTGSTNVGSTCLLGESLVPCSLVPLAVTGGHLFQALSSGGDHACALTTAGTGSDIYCWGRNSTGQLGNGGKLDAASSPTPVRVLRQ